MADQREFYVPPPDPAQRRLDAFVSRYWADSCGDEEVRAHLRADTGHRRLSLSANLADLEAVLANPDDAWRLVWLVEVAANTSLHDGAISETEHQALARAFLERFAAMVREALDATRHH